MLQRTSIFLGCAVLVGLHCQGCNADTTSFSKPESSKCDPIVAGACRSAIVKSAGRSAERYAWYVACRDPTHRTRIYSLCDTYCKHEASKVDCLLDKIRPRAWFKSIQDEMGPGESAAVEIPPPDAPVEVEAAESPVPATPEEATPESPAEDGGDGDGGMEDGGAFPERTQTASQVALLKFPSRHSHTSSPSDTAASGAGADGTRGGAGAGADDRDEAEPRDVAESRAAAADGDSEAAGVEKAKDGAGSPAQQHAGSLAQTGDPYRRGKFTKDSIVREHQQRRLTERADAPDSAELRDSGPARDSAHWHAYSAASSGESFGGSRGSMSRESREGREAYVRESDGRAPSFSGPAKRSTDPVWSPVAPADGRPKSAGPAEPPRRPVKEDGEYRGERSHAADRPVVAGGLSSFKSIRMGSLLETNASTDPDSLTEMNSSTDPDSLTEMNSSNVSSSK